MGHDHFHNDDHDHNHHGDADHDHTHDMDDFWSHFVEEKDKSTKPKATKSLDDYDVLYDWNIEKEIGYDFGSCNNYVKTKKCVMGHNMEKLKGVTLEQC